MDLNARPRALRASMTEAERMLWKHLRNGALGHRFRRQHPLGPYVLDFVCLERRLVIEVDGGQHFENPRDEARDAWLLAQGYRTVRFWNHEVLGNVEGVLARLVEALG